MIILGIDTGTRQSAYCAIDCGSGTPISHGKVSNLDLQNIVKNEYYDAIGVEGFACYGGQVGAETFDSAYMVGRVQQIADDRGADCYLVLRRHVKKYLLGKSSGKGCNDAAVRQALLEKYGDNIKGMNNDERSAYAVALTLANEFKTKGDGDNG